MGWDWDWMDLRVGGGIEHLTVPIIALSSQTARIQRIIRAQTRKSTKYKVQTILFKLINCVGILRNGGANPSMNVRFCEVPATIL